jgi:hypothetical protein
MNWHIEINKELNGDIFDMYSRIQDINSKTDIPTMIISYEEKEPIISIECYSNKKNAIDTKEWLKYISVNEFSYMDDTCIVSFIDSEYPEKDAEAIKSLAVQFLIKKGVIEEESDDEFIFNEW